MIITRISSGLGNQLFQYATAKAISIRNSDQLKLDISYYSEFSDRKYLLGKFNIPEAIADTNEINTLTGSRNSSIISKIRRKLSKNGIEYYGKFHIKEKPFQSFEQNVLKLKGDIYLDGYWQNELYFKEIRNMLCNIFTINTNLDSYYNNVLQLIHSNNAVSVHVRNGDYKFNSYFKVLSIEYYTKAINIILKKEKSPVFFVFSDDPIWAKKVISPKIEAVFINHPTQPLEHIELCLMKECSHNIIANSSFSWWGAWLNCNKNQVVIAPKDWLENERLNKLKTSYKFLLDWTQI